MTYSILFSKKAKKFFRKLPKKVRERLKEAFRGLSEEPFRYLEHFEGEPYKFRIGDYRALMDIDFERRILWVRLFDKRGRIYKRHSKQVKLVFKKE